MSRKEVKQRERITPQKLPRAVESPESYLKRAPVWAFSRCDKKQWSLFNSEMCFDVLKTLASYEGMTWQDIQSAAGGKSAGHGANNHFVNVAALAERAQKRARELKLDEITDQLFSLRINGKTRLFGVLEQGVFYVVWLDVNHEICPVRK